MDIVTFFLIWVTIGSIMGVLAIIRLYNIRDKVENGDTLSWRDQHIYDHMTLIGNFMSDPYLTMSILTLMFNMMTGPLVIPTRLYGWYQSRKEY